MKTIKNAISPLHLYDRSPRARARLQREHDRKVALGRKSLTITEKIDAIIDACYHNCRDAKDWYNDALLCGYSDSVCEQRYDAWQAAQELGYRTAQRLRAYMRKAGMYNDAWYVATKACYM